MRNFNNFSSRLRRNGVWEKVKRSEFFLNSVNIQCEIRQADRLDSSRNRLSVVHEHSVIL